MTSDSVRWVAAAAVLALYAALCLTVWLGVRRKARAAASAAARLLPAREGSQAILVAYASQTGHAEAIAWQTAELLHTAGEAVRLLPLGQVTPEQLSDGGRALLIVSTYGEGDAPDNAAAFVRGAMASQPDLSRLHAAVLALGDSQYDNFCGFGRRLDGWLRECGAQPLFDRIDADDAHPGGLAEWWRQLGHVAAIDPPAAPRSQPFDAWTLVERRHLNPGSTGGPMYLLAFVAPAQGSQAQASSGERQPPWQSGDLVQFQLPDDPAHPRDYSIASIPQDGRLELLVRLERRSDGSTGAASGWLTGELPLGGEAALRIRAHRNFRLGDNAARPLVLIGNGSGLAGLRSHLRARALAGQSRNWLVFGERERSRDSLCAEEIARWQADGILARVDLAFSRDAAKAGGCRYVQHCLAAASGTLVTWIDEGAAIYVCGSLQGMAGAVDDTLAAILGRDRLDALTRDGRYRRDVY